MRRTILLLAVLALAVGAAWRRSDAYILRSGKTHVIRTSTTINELVPLQRRLREGSYLWVRIDSREWLSRDEALLREAAALWAHVEALSPEQHAVDEEERRLDKRIDAIEDRKATAEPGELARLRDRNAVVSRHQRELDQREEALEKVAEAKLRQLVDEAIRDGRAKELR